MSAKHTQKPWTIDETDEYIFIEPGVAVVEREIEGYDKCDMPNKCAMPNARLIAAAPDLLEALRNLLEEGEFTDYPNTRQWFAVKAAREAIAKATGSAT